MLCYLFFAGTEFFDSDGGFNYKSGTNYKKERQHYIGYESDLHYHKYDWDVGAKAKFEAAETKNAIHPDLRGLSLGAKAKFEAGVQQIHPDLRGLSLGETSFLETFSSSEQSILNTPVRFHSLNYMDGAAMHFAAAATKQ